SQRQAVARAVHGGTGTHLVTGHRQRAGVGRVHLHADRTGTRRGAHVAAAVLLVGHRVGRHAGQVALVGADDQAVRRGDRGGRRPQRVERFVLAGRSAQLVVGDRQLRVVAIARLDGEVAVGGRTHAATG